MLPHRIRFLRLFFMLALAIQAGCGKSPSGPSAQRPSSITLSTYEVVLTKVGQRVLINATVLDQDSKVITNETVNWRSADGSIATVSNRGVVSAVSMGTTQLTATSGDATARATVSVELEVGFIEITPSSATLETVGATVQMKAVVYDRGNTPIPGAAVVWSSSHPEVATVDANGLVTAVARGFTAITAASGGLGTSRPVFVEIPRVAERIELNLESAWLTAVGESLQLQAVVYDVDGAVIPGAPVEWSSSDSKIATVDADGLVKAVSNGIAQITAISGDASANAEITVTLAAASITSTSF